MDFVSLRKKMVEDQLIPRGICDKRILEAFYKVERHKFIPAEEIDHSYGDYPVPIGKGQTISQPFIVALMTQCLDLKGDEKVLEIGTGSGYQAAILAELSKEVYTIERLEPIANATQKLLENLGYKNIRTKVSDGTLGWPEEAPFDRVIITAATADIPAPLYQQLKTGGRIVAPVGDIFTQTLTVVTKQKDDLITNEICPCVFVPLVGKYGLRQ